ncbi:MAG: SAM-dependent methyltransferase [Clostridia bacterium]|nr:SAM-dependent methyltransferase [Clostridia bacterium]
MTHRIKTLCSLIPPCTSFADVGCDHGYISEFVLKTNLCDRVTVADVSKGSLKKAQTLLSDEIERGRCTAVLCDGLEKISPDTDFVLIAGMGGMEIVGILERGFLPKRFLFQPMKNTETLRRYLVSRGARLFRDFTFRDDKYYDVIVGERNGYSDYSELDFRYGKENLERRPQAFLDSLKDKNEKQKQFLERLPDGAKRDAMSLIREREAILANR